MTLGFSYSACVRRRRAERPSLWECERPVIYVSRKLWFQKPGDQDRTIVAEDDLPGLSKAIVVLGEPGMGKTELLKRLAKAGGTVSHPAGKLINSYDPAKLLGNATTLVIDALDEVTANREGAAVDRVVQKLDAAGNPPFILSCRVADWQAATSTQTIEDMYGVAPLPVHLIELERADQIAILADLVGAERASDLLAHFETFDLDLLGNPQTLLMIARLSVDEPLPKTRGDLFEKAIDQLWREHKKGRGAIELDREAALDAAGAAFAALILTGSSAVVRHGATHLGEGELAFAEIDVLAGGTLARILGSRLFEGGEDSFTYWHRRIGEFLGARWLSKRADTPAKRRRLLHLFQSLGLVPANLRGLHAWLVRDPALALDVITADPMGVVEYGDADALTGDQAAAMLRAVRHLAVETAAFWRWTPLRAGAVVSGSLKPEIEAILRDPSAPVDLRAFLAQQIAGSETIDAYRDLARRLMRDPAEVFAIRQFAAEGLMRAGGEDWRDHIEELRCQGSEDSTRLAFEMMHDIGIGSYTDAEVVELVLACDGLTLEAVPQQPKRNMSLRFWHLIELIPDERLDGVLNELTRYARELLPKHADYEEHELTDAALRLILRRLELGGVDPASVRSWLLPYRDQTAFTAELRAKIERWFRDSDDVRRALQAEAILTGPEGTIWERHWHLSKLSAGLAVDEGDVVALLALLDPNDLTDTRWQEVLVLIGHDGVHGCLARKAAEPFAARDPALRGWLEQLENPPIPKWELKNAAYEKRRSKEREKKFSRLRLEYSAALENVRLGEFRYMHGPASAYLKLFSDLSGDGGGRRRLIEWLGEDLASAVCEGFEQNLRTPTPQPSSKRIAVGYAKNKFWYAPDITIAALAERLRVGRVPFDGVQDDRLLGALFQLWMPRIDTRKEFADLLAQVEAEIRLRDLWARAHRLFVTPQLRHGDQHPSRLYAFLHFEADAELAAELAVEWLNGCADLPINPEADMIDRILRSSRRDELRGIGARRLSVSLDDARRRNWEAVEILLDFEAAVARSGGAPEPDLMWSIRARLSGWRDEREAIPLNPSQYNWLVASFRAAWPATPRPTGVTRGSANAWDATDYLNGLIARLGENTSDEAIWALEALRDMPEDGYTDRIKAVLAEQRRKRVEQVHVPPTLAEIRAIVEAGPPTTASDLQAVMLENLATAQDRLRGDPVDWYRGFYRDDGKNHEDEEDCRDELIKLLEAIDNTLEYTPEAHVADDKRVDIVARVSRQPILPIEIKGTWHQKLWTAADDQLSHLYVEDWRAERGIYLVLWFGIDPKMPKPPAGVTVPTTPGELRQALIATSVAARRGEVDVVVLDLKRP